MFYLYSLTRANKSLNNMAALMCMHAAFCCNIPGRNRRGNMFSNNIPYYSNAA